MATYFLYCNDWTVSKQQLFSQLETVATLLCSCCNFVKLCPLLVVERKKLPAYRLILLPLGALKIVVVVGVVYKIPQGFLKRKPCGLHLLWRLGGLRLANETLALTSNLNMCANVTMILYVCPASQQTPAINNSEKETKKAAARPCKEVLNFNKREGGKSGWWADFPISAGCVWN